MSDDCVQRQENRAKQGLLTIVLFLGLGAGLSILVTIALCILNGGNPSSPSPVPSPLGITPTRGASTNASTPTQASYEDTVDLAADVDALRARVSEQWQENARLTDEIAQMAPPITDQSEAPRWIAVDPQNWLERVYTRTVEHVAIGYRVWTVETRSDSPLFSGEMMVGLESRKGPTSTTVEAGWPMHWISGQMVTRDGAEPSYYGAVTVLLRGENVLFPLSPSPLALLCNSLLYGSVVLTAFLLLSIGRRIGRATRGVCLRCGYDLVGINNASCCPECGLQM